MHPRVGHENVVHREVAAAGAAQAGCPPGVLHGHLAATHVAAHGWSTRRHGEPHEMAGVMGAGAEGPATGEPVSAFDRRQRSDRAGGADDKGLRRLEYLARDPLRQNGRHSAHATAIADNPADGAVQFRGGLDNGHEIQGRELRPSQRFRQVQLEEARRRHRPKQIVWQTPVAVEIVAAGRDHRSEPVQSRQVTSHRTGDIYGHVHRTPPPRSRMVGARRRRWQMRNKRVQMN
mgnify:CR=1 FL=1